MAGVLDIFLQAGCPSWRTTTSSKPVST